MKLYICVLDQVPDQMVPVLVAHAVLRHHLAASAQLTFHNQDYWEWLDTSFRKCVVKVTQKEFDKISKLPYSTQSWENTTLGGKPSCVTVVVKDFDIPNVIKFAKLWKPMWNDPS